MPKDGRPTKERILDVAERLVIDNGFAATSLDQVIAEASTSKGAFFHHFGSKLDLARALVERYAAADIANLEQAIAEVRKLTDDPAQQVIEFVRVFEERADEIMSAQSGCLYVSVLTEQQLAADGTWEKIQKAIVAWRDTLAQLLREAGTTIDAEALADHVFVTFEGAFLLARSMGDAGHMRAQLRVLRQLIEAALSAEKEDSPQAEPG